MTKSVLIESMRLPPLSVVHTIVTHSGFILEACENYQKRSYRNRLYLAGPNGPQMFSIPLAKGKNERQKITDVVLSYDEPWHHNLVKLIKTCYGSAPFFEYLIDEITWILDKKHQYLFDLNVDFHVLIQKYIDSYNFLGVSESYDSVIQDKASCVDLRDHFKPNKADESIKVLPQYPQVFEEKNGFVSNMSILDLMMCMGREATIYLDRIC